MCDDEDALTSPSFREGPVAELLGKLPKADFTGQ
jgi:hypothetical protein